VLIIEKIRKIPYGIIWRVKLFWQEYILKLPIHTRRFFVLRSKALKERKLLIKARKRFEIEYYTNPNPLVSIVVPTWNRAEILTKKVLPKLINQTYKNTEIIIVGDHCTDETENMIKEIKDKRIIFHNLEKRGDYPKRREFLHMVAGSAPNTKGQAMAKGLWIAHCDDDEEWLLDHIEVLLRYATNNNLELVWGKTNYEVSPGVWAVQGSEKFNLFDIPHSTLFMRTYIRLFKPDLNSWKLRIGGDRNRLRRMYYAGVRGGFLNRVVTKGPLRPGNTRQWANAEDRENY